MAKVNNVWRAIEEHQKKGKSGAYVPVARESDLLIALNNYKPGYKNEFHHHNGTSQSFLVLKGELTLRTRPGVNEPVTEYKVKEGECAMMSVGEYYQLENATSEPLVLYQAKQPTDLVQIHGKDPVNAREHFGDAI
jgi:mannose-6-phosphate isomerase-like protein (cupin superfamily)